MSGLFEAVAPRARDGAVAAVVAAVVSGAPSTLWALARGRDPLEAVRAAGTALIPAAGPLVGIAAGAVVHGVVSLGWGVVLGCLVPRQRPVVAGSVAGVAIAGLDLGLIAPRFVPEVAALDVGPQVADHLLFGATVGAVLRLRQRRRHRDARVTRSRR